MQPQRSILLMKHPKRWDLPKGHVDEGETNLECALRELQEETGIEQHHLRIDPQFKYKDRYTVETRKRKKKKTLIIFLAELIEDVEIVPSEHESFQWIDWNPPHVIQEKTIDPLLAQLHTWWSDASDMTKDQSLEIAASSRTEQT